MNGDGEDDGGMFMTHKTPCKPLSDLEKDVKSNETKALKREKEEGVALNKVEKELHGIKSEFRMFVLLKYGDGMLNKMQEHSNPGLDDKLKRQQIITEVKKGKLIDVLIRIGVVAGAAIGGFGYYFYFS